MEEIKSDKQHQLRKGREGKRSPRSERPATSCGSQGGVKDRTPGDAGGNSRQEGRERKEKPWVKRGKADRGKFQKSSRQIFISEGENNTGRRGGSPQDKPKGPLHLKAGG